MARTLVLIRHAKSDWSQPVDDHQRPLAARGRRQAPAIGHWIETDLGASLDLAVVSSAVRAQQTWELAADGLAAPVVVSPDSAVYTFSGRQLAAVVAKLPPAVTTVAVVGHNPAMEDLVAELTGTSIRMPTAALAVIELAQWSETTGRLLTAGRPADGPLS